ncbi:MAG TPA: hypothetical protein VJ596_00195, partial [Gemmatimonadaceae bacterium]|nr:hypothetical protein [Gemmatimonadaceae bacterium]
VFGGRPVRMRIVGRALAHHFLRPFRHLLLDEALPLPAVPATRMEFWDESETGIPCPPVAPAADDAVWPTDDGQFVASADGRIIRYECADAITWLDRAAGRVVGWRAAGAALSIVERTRPMPYILPLWYQAASMLVIHGALVARGKSGIFFGGAGGAGKSTCALSCLSAGLDYLSDDHIGLEELSDGSFVGHSMFSSTRVEPDHLQRFPRLRAHGIASDHPTNYKALVLLAEVVPARIRRHVNIDAVVLPQIVQAEGTRFRPASKADTLRLIAPTSLFMIPPRPGREGFEKLARMVQAVPTYWLEIGRDLEAIPPRVNELFDLLQTSTGT